MAIPLPDFSQGVSDYYKKAAAQGFDFWKSNPLPEYGYVGGGQAAPLPDFNTILANDPYYQAALANLNAAGVYDKASRDAAIKQAMIRFGYAPEAVAGMTFPEPVLGQPGHQHPSTLATILDPATRSLIQQNTTAGLSIWARLMDAAKQQQKRTVDVLGSRGLFRSGETGYQLQRGQLAADQARYDATNKLMDFLTGAQSAYVQAEMQRQALLLQEQLAAAERGSGLPPTQPPTQPPSHPPTHPPSHPPTHAPTTGPTIDDVLKAIAPALGTPAGPNQPGQPIGGDPKEAFMPPPKWRPPGGGNYQPM